MITNLRNHLYNIGQKKSFQFDIWTINVGNLTVGGTGKTPHIEYLIRLLQNQFRIATLSRGYKRKTKGFLIANSSSTTAQIGDEPMQFYQKFGNQLTVVVGEDRAEAIPKILLEIPETEAILLDDAFQHRRVRPHLNILLTDYYRLFYQDFPLPAGRLRESRQGAKRADCVIVTKCPENLEANQKQTIIRAIQVYTRPQTPIFFTGIHYGAPLGKNFNLKDNAEKSLCYLISGIAQPNLLEQYVSKHFSLQHHFKFPDHHHYSIADIQKIISQINQTKETNKFLLTTEKDFVKLNQPTFQIFWEKIPLFYIPIEVFFLENETLFRQLVLESMPKMSSL